MQAAAARAVAQAGVRSSVLRGVLLAAGVAARATKRTVERIVRLEALLYVTGEITLADILLYVTATFEDVPPEPEPEPAPQPDVGVRILVCLIVFAGAVMAIHSVANAVDDYCRTRNTRRRPHAQTGQCHSRSSHEAPPGPPPKPKPAPLPPGAIEYFDAGRAVAAWIRECEAAGIKHHILQRK